MTFADLLHGDVFIYPTEFLNGAYVTELFITIDKETGDCISLVVDSSGYTSIDRQPCAPSNMALPLEQAQSSIHKPHYVIRGGELIYMGTP